MYTSKFQYSHSKKKAAKLTLETKMYSLLSSNIQTVELPSCHYWWLHNISIIKEKLELFEKDLFSYS